jgi:succinate dehydrogenase / fumarate reductase flavoprotein subunit
VPRRAAPHRELRWPLPAESQTDDGEAKRDDEHFSYAAAWEYTGQGQAPVLHKEDLVFEYVTPSQRSYK